VLLLNKYFAGMECLSPCFPIVVVKLTVTGMRQLGSSVVFSSVYFDVLTVFVYKNLLIFAARVLKTK